MSETEFHNRNLRGARFVACDLSGVVMRAVGISGADIDSPWLLESESPLLINGVDVTGYVEAEFNRRFPGRELRLASTPEGLRDAWSALESAWSSALDRVRTMPPGTVDTSVAGEWSFSQTLRHLVMATDTWLRGAILALEAPYHPAGQPNTEYETDGYDMGVFSETSPTYQRVLDVRAERQAMMRDDLRGVSEQDLAASRRNPWAPQYLETVLSCLHTIIGEEWDHLRFALRDLDTLAAGVA